MNPRIEVKFGSDGFFWELVDEDDRTLARSSMTYRDLARCEGHAWRVIALCRDPAVTVGGPGQST
jgi:hypothetical protein